MRSIGEQYREVRVAGDKRMREISDSFEDSDLEVLWQTDSPHEAGILVRMTVPSIKVEFVNIDAEDECDSCAFEAHRALAA